jgi:hypothetical protein
MEDDAASGSAGRRPSNDALVGCAMAAVAVVLGLLNANRSFSYDEAITYSNFINGGSPRTALTTQVVFNNHPMFSFFEVILWRIGLVSEAAQRLLPVSCGAATVGLIAWYTSCRSTIVGGSVAGSVLLLNPMYFDLFRAVRGYSLAVLGITVAGIAIQRSWHDPRRRWLALQGVAMVIAVTTHAYSAVFILTFAVATLALGHLRARLVIAWVASAVVAVVIALPILDDALDNAEARGNRYVPGFGEFTLREVLGRTTPVVFIVGVLVLVGAISVGQRSTRHAVAVVAGAVVPLAVFMLIWQIAQPFDLYSRFFIGLMPFVAVLAGLGSSRLPDVPAGAVGIAVVVLLAPTVRTLIDREAGTRDAGQLVDEARAIDLQVCGYGAEAIWVYTAQIEYADLEQLDNCDVLVNGLGLRDGQLELVNNHYAARLRVDGSISLWGDTAAIERLGAGR